MEYPELIIIKDEHYGYHVAKLTMEITEKKQLVKLYEIKLSFKTIEETLTLGVKK